MACHRTSDHEQNTFSIARACAAPWATDPGAGPFAFAASFACGFAGLPADTSDKCASCSLTIPPAAASHGYADNPTLAWNARSPGSANATQTDRGQCSCHTSHRARTALG